MSSIRYWKALKWTKEKEETKLWEVGTARYRFGVNQAQEVNTKKTKTKRKKCTRVLGEAKNKTLLATLFPFRWIKVYTFSTIQCTGTNCLFFQFFSFTSFVLYLLCNSSFCRCSVSLFFLLNLNQMLFSLIEYLCSVIWVERKKM